LERGTGCVPEQTIEAHPRGTPSVAAATSPPAGAMRVVGYVTRYPAPLRKGVRGARVWHAYPHTHRNTPYAFTQWCRVDCLPQYVEFMRKLC
jgi:hypothetical protein